MIKYNDILGTELYTIVDTSNTLLVEELIENGRRVFNKYMGIYESDNFSYFRTPYSMDPKSTGPGYQYEPENRELFLKYEKYLNTVLLDKVEKQYKVSDMWYLYQTDEEWVDNPIHQHLTSDKVAVIYLINNDQDNIIFYDNNKKNSLTYYPKKGEIVVFNSDTFHKPGTTVGTKRLSLNVELNTL